jgi:hypothetical protein
MVIVATAVDGLVRVAWVVSIITAVVDAFWSSLVVVVMAVVDATVLVVLVSIVAAVC